MTWSVAAGSGDLLLRSGRSIALSDGSLVTVSYNATAGTMEVRRSVDRAVTPTLLGSVPASTGYGIAGFYVGGSPHYGNIGVCADASDNIYLVGPSGLTNGNMAAVALVKSGGTWTLGTAQQYAGLAANNRAASIRWCNTGGGTNAKGHLLVVESADVQRRAYGLDAGAVLANAVPARTTLTGLLTVSNANLMFDAADLDANSLGALAGVMFMYTTNTSPGNVVAYGWSMSAVGVVTVGAATTIGTNAVDCNSATRRPRVLRYATDKYAVKYDNGVFAPNIARITSVAGGTPTIDTAATAMTLTGYGLRSGYESSVFLDPAAANRIWVVESNTASPYAPRRFPVDLATGVVQGGTGTVVQDPPWPGSGNPSTVVATSPPTGTTVDFIESTSGTLYGSAGDFNVAPLAPTNLIPASGTIDRAVVQRFSWQFNDPNPTDSQSKFDLQYRLGTGAWTTVTQNTPNRFYDFPAATFAAGNYEWQVRTYDSFGLVGPWSASAFFTAADAPSDPTITSPTNGSTVGTSTGTVTWSAASQDSYQVRKLADNAGTADTTTVYYDSAEVISTARSAPLTFPVNNRFEHIQVRIRVAGLWSAWASVRVNVSYTPPATPTLTTSSDSLNGRITVTITDPTPSGSQPAVVSHDVFSRVVGSTSSVRRAVALGGTTFIDYAPASGVAYEYQVVANGVNGVTSTSVWVA